MTNLTTWNGLTIYKRNLTNDERMAYQKIRRIIRYLDSHDDGAIYPETFDILAEARYQLAEYYC